MLVGLPSYGRDNNQLKNTLMGIGRQGKISKQIDGPKMAEIVP